MAANEAIKNELEMGLRLLQWQPVSLELAPMAVVEEAMRENGWDPVSGLSGDGKDTEWKRVFYNSAVKTYGQVSCNGYTGACSVTSVDESDVLEHLTFPELQHLSDLIDKKSVEFIRIFREKELASASSEEELKAINERNEKWIAEAEVALRKR